MTTEDADPFNADQGAIDAEESAAPRLGSLIIDRLAHIEPMEVEPLEWLPPSVIAERIGTNRRWVHLLVKEFGIESELTKYGDEQRACYPPFTLPLLRDEYEWRRNLRQLPSRLSVNQLAENIGRSQGWTHKALERLAMTPAGTGKNGGKRFPLYSKATLQELRRESMAFPPDGDFKNLHQLEVATEEDRQWIERRLQIAGIKPETRRSSLTGRLHEYYPPNSLSVIKEAQSERPPAGAEWRTAEALISTLGKSLNWIRLRLSHYQHLAEQRLADNRVPRLHYPPAVVEALKQEVQILASYPESGDFLTFSDIAKMTGRSQLWVHNRLGRLEVQPEARRDKHGRVRGHYPPDVITKILELPTDLRSS